MPIPTWTDQSGPTPGTPLSAANLQAISAADLTEAATNDTLGGSSSYVNNLNRIRYQLGQLVGGAWNAAVQMLPLSQKAAASGVASLDASTHVVQKAAKGVRDWQSSVLSADTNLNSSPSTLAAVPNLSGLSLTADSGSKITFAVTGTYVDGTGGNAYLRFAVRLDSTSTYIYMGMSVGLSSQNRVNFSCRALYTPADTSAHTYTLYYDTNGASWTSGQVSVAMSSAPQNDALVFEAIEHS